MKFKALTLLTVLLFGSIISIALATAVSFNYSVFNSATKVYRAIGYGANSWKATIDVNGLSYNATTFGNFKVWIANQTTEDSKQLTIEIHMQGDKTEIWYKEQGTSTRIALLGSANNFTSVDYYTVSLSGGSLNIGSKKGTVEDPDLYVQNYAIGANFVPAYAVGYGVANCMTSGYGTVEVTAAGIDTFNFINLLMPTLVTVITLAIIFKFLDKILGKLKV